MFADIAAALEAVEEGGTVIVEAGMYFGNFVVDRPVMLRAEGAVTLVAAAGAPAIAVTSDDVTIQGLLVQAAETCTGVRVHADCGRPEPEPCIERVRILDMEISAVCRVDGAVVDGVGIDVVRGADILVSGNTIDDVLGGAYDRANASCTPIRPGRVAAGVRVLRSRGVQVLGNVALRVRGGAGDPMLSACGSAYRGGDGGLAAGVLLQETHDGLLIDNHLTDLRGGRGGNSNATRWATGPGGPASGVVMIGGSTGNRLVANLIGDLEGGEPGYCIHEGEECLATRGAPGGVVGVHLELVDRNGVEVPNSSLANTVEESNLVDGEAVVYLHGAFGGVIEGHRLEGETPTTNLGKIALVDCQGVTVRNNVIANLVGAPGGSTTQYRGPGRPGGTARGVYVRGGQLNRVEGNEITDLTGGVGGTASITSAGGAGGMAIGVHVEDSTQAVVRDNRLQGLRGGAGGLGCAGGAGGVGGHPVGVTLARAARSATERNVVSSLASGAGGPGGVGWGEEGLDGQTGWATGIAVKSSDPVTLSNDLIHDLQGRRTAGIHLQAAPAAETVAEIAHATLYFVRADSDAAGIRVDRHAEATITNSIVSRAEHAGVLNADDNDLGDVNIRHSVFWRNGELDDDADDLVHVEADPASVLFEDPGFGSPANGDFSLNADSPCIDAGAGECPEEPSGDGQAAICDIGHQGNTPEGRFR